jgi:hypothetical protein
MNPFRRRIQTAMQQGGGAVAWTPASIAGLKVWLDTTDAANVTVATGASQITDLSGNGNHATQASGSKQPSYTSNQYVTFDGVDDWMEIPALGSIGTNSRSYVAKIYFTALQQGYVLSHYSDGGGTYPGLMLCTSDSAGTAAGKRASGFDNSNLSPLRRPVSTGDVDSATVTVALVRTSTTDKLYINGVLDTSLTGSSINNATNFKTFLGALGQGDVSPVVGFFNGRVIRVLIYTSELTATDVLNLYNAGY